MAETTIGAKIDEETKRDVRIEAAKQGITMSQYVRLAINEKLERDQSEGNPKPAVATAD